MTAHLDRLEPRRLCDGGHSVPGFGTATAPTVVTVPFRSHGKGETANVQELLADTRGYVYVVAHTQSSLQVRRLRPDGAGDFSFNQGVGVLDFAVPRKLLDGRHAGTTDIALDPADRLYVLLGDTITRFTADGKLDASFGTAGTFTLTGLVGARQIAVDASNKIWVAGSVSTGKTVGLLQFTVARIASRGKYDKSFDGDGKLTLPLPGGNNGDRSTGDFVRVLADGTIVAAAAVDDRPVEAPAAADQARGVQVAHFRRNGTLDRTFGDGGVVSRVVTDTADVQNFLRPEAVRPDGSVVLRPLTVDGPTPAASLITRAGVVADFTPSVDASVNNDFKNARFFESRGHEFVATPADRTLLRLTGDAYDTAFAPGGRFEGNGGVFPVLAAGADDADGTVLTATAASKPLSVNVSKLFADGRPIAAFQSAPVSVRQTYVGFTVTYDADAGLAAGTLDGNELRVIGPDGTTARPRLRTVTTSPAGATVAEYRFALPGGTLDPSDVGTYTVRLLDGTVVSADDVANARQTLANFVLT